MTTILKILAIVLIGLYFSACSSRPVKEPQQEVRLQWDIEKSEKEKFMISLKECEDFAFKAIIAGSRYQEDDISNNCMYRKGYKTKVVTVSNQ